LIGLSVFNSICVLFTGINNTIASLISEVYVNGRKEDVWCETNAVLSEDVRKTLGSSKAAFECVVPSCILINSAFSGTRLQYPKSSFYLCDNTVLYKNGLEEIAFICQ
jgi:hypothetical protein